MGVYVEPFAGSLACLLANPAGPAPREIVCDLDGGICNFWRALAADPDEVARWADWPTIHQDLTARHRWLVQWVMENRERLETDPTYYDARAAGWWVWGISLWIGGGWCQPGYRGSEEAPERMPKFLSTNGTPNISQRNGVHGNSRPDLLEWFARLADRLKGVVVLNRSWQSALTPSLLQQTETGPKPPVGILLDPPYLQDDRDADIYGSDAIGASNEAARESWAWALEHGGRFRIAYCCHEGDVGVPDGWAAETQSFAGIRQAARRHRRDMVLFSPACVPAAQQRLFG